MNNSDFQHTILNLVLQKHSDKKAEAVSALSKLLFLGVDAVYRRFSGHTELSIDQLLLIAKKYEISLDQFVFEHSENLIFKYSSFPNEIKQIEDYLEKIRTNVKSFCQLSNFRAFYATNEIPIFIYLFFPKLLTFKLYIYSLTVWKVEYSKKIKFSFDFLSPYAEKITLDTAQMYVNIETTDIWNLNIIDYTLNQVSNCS